MTKQHPNVKALRDFNRWRRGEHERMPHPTAIGELIDWAINVCEAADKLVSGKGKHADENYRRLEEAVEGKVV